MLILDFLGIGESIGVAIQEIMIWLAQCLYSLAASAFQIFLLLADGSILKSIDYGVVLTNFYTLISVIMLFIVAFSLLKGMIDPDDKKYGTAAVKKIIINTITSFIIMAVLPTIFNFAFDFQNAMVVDYNPLGSFFGYGNLDGSTTSGNTDEIEYSANQIVSSVFTAFLNVECGENECTTLKDIENKQDNVLISNNTSTISFASAINKVNKTGSFSTFTQFGQKVYDGEMFFDFLLAIVAGGILIYIAVSYCFDMALRLIKLIFYQLIAPIPIFFRIVPDGKLSGTFGEWVKITLACYLEVFVRLFVFYFVIFLCQSVIASDVLNTLTAGRGYFISLFTKAFLLMGLVTFMKAAPGLISKVTGIDSGNMKLGIKEKLAAGGGFAAGALIGGGVTAGIRNLTNAGQNVANKFKKGEDGKWHLKEGETKGGVAKAVAAGLFSTTAGGLSGAARSAKAGSSAKSFGDMKNASNSGATAAVKARDDRATYKANHGGTFFGAAKGHVKDAVRGLGEFAGIGVISSQEADYFSNGANAFDAAHNQIESAYKGKPEHNKIKERITELQGEKSKVEKEIQGLENFYGPLTEDQTRHLSELRQRLSVLKSDLAAQNDFKSEHEAKEMSKKMSLSMEAINNLVNAKMKYIDMSTSIFDDKLYSLLKDSSGSTDSEAIRKFVEKIQNNQTINMNDLRREDGTAIIDMKSLETFIDQAGIKAKDMAAEKRVQVAHAKALKTENKSDKK